MAIRFTCPSCQQPIEVDDEWAGQSVGCPYCKKVVNAPSGSDWPPGDVHVASPAQPATGTSPPSPTEPPPSPGFAPPPPPPGYAPPAGGTVRRSPTASWALTLAITCVVLAIVGWIALFAPIWAELFRKAGSHATQAEMEEAQREIMEKIMSGERSLGNAWSTACGVIGALCGLGGLGFGIVSLVRQEPRRTMAIVSCILSASFLCCPSFLVAFSYAPMPPPGSGVPATQPAGPDAEPGTSSDESGEVTRALITKPSVCDAILSIV